MIQEETKAGDASAKKVGAANYNLALQDTEKGVVTRFLPEPSYVLSSISRLFERLP